MIETKKEVVIVDDTDPNIINYHKVGRLTDQLDRAYAANTSLCEQIVHLTEQNKQLQLGVNPDINEDVVNQLKAEISRLEDAVETLKIQNKNQYDMIVRLGG